MPFSRRTFLSLPLLASATSYAWADVLQASAAPQPFGAEPKNGKTHAEITDANAQQGAIGIVDEPEVKSVPHTAAAGAQWFPQAGFGLFIHWGLSSVFDTRGKRVGDLSWAMMAGVWKNKTITDPKEQERIVREADWNFDGKPPAITPNQYWAAAKDFDPQNYDPDKWIAAARAAGFTYAVLTTRHHEGFALWPSAYGDFSTKNFMHGRDLVKPFVEACRKYGLKVGLYYSPPNWYFDRDYMNFMDYGTAKMNPWLPELDPDLKPRTEQKTQEQKAKHLAAYNAMIKGQVEELLTRYGKIDLLWFDGAIPAPADGAPRLTQARVRELQPDIVLSPRYFHDGDYVTFEGPALETREVARDYWAEWCTTWTQGWAYNDAPFYANGFVLGNLALARSLNINYLLDVGPDAHGELHPNAYKDMAVVADWMKVNGAAVRAGALPRHEKASVPATATNGVRFLFAIPEFKRTERALDADLIAPTDKSLTLEGLAAMPKAVFLLGDGKPLKSEFKDGKLAVELPASRRTTLPDVVEVELD
ncbi:alpha-L-fucosidase [Paraburkholderia mimosarum]|uniref:alpha-L-fucosidase n=1 Tax=Paraburkholderia mimosarum TaxID=312026 RepID=UPI00138DDAC7|nr:alpha-L-fucosidase [Paraburkholderia mimosarum]